MRQYLEFEKELGEIESEMDRARALTQDGDEATVKKLEVLERDFENKLASLYSELTPWQQCQIARHPNRPHMSDFLRILFTDQNYLAGDRCFADDLAVPGCLARFDGRPVVVIGQEKGNDTNSRIRRNFGMARPEGYRKAIRLMDLANRFGLPVITFVDTPGAYPGKGAEERGQSEAIARTTEKCLSLEVPLVSIIVGEGGSGGAVAFASANRTAMMQYSVYSVISPEGCASILWKDSEKMQEAASALKLTAQDLKSLGVIDRIIDEPLGGAHRDPTEAVHLAGKVLAEMLDDVRGMDAAALRRSRHERFMSMGTKGL